MYFRIMPVVTKINEMLRSTKFYKILPDY